jgi:pantoate--beta-alanine ligase
MGALHQGHLTLIAKARAECKDVVVSIFVNPIQFNQQEDFAHYPRTFESDARQCSEAGVDLIFAPGAQEMYPAPIATFVDVPSLGEHLCGPHRPGHFRGVATVVMKLFQIVQPDFAYFGEKDAQQLAVIRRMVRDLNVPVEIVPVPTVREPDGLALSSRNQRLTAEERRIAPMLYRALEIAAREMRHGAAGIEKALKFLQSEPRIRLEYLEVVDPAGLQAVSGSELPVLIAIAAWIGDVRLIDNLLVPA